MKNDWMKNEMANNGIGTVLTVKLTAVPFPL
jgi:hypothetical protein